MKANDDKLYVDASKVIELILDRNITEYGIVAHTPENYALRIRKISADGMFYGLICPMCGLAHLIPAKLEYSMNPINDEKIIFINSIFCPARGINFDVRDELIYMTLADAHINKLL